MSRPTEAVKTAGIIRPLRIAEITDAVHKGVGGHRQPNGIGYIRAGFDDDCLIAGPVDVETELIGAHAETVVMDLNLRQPQSGGPAAKHGNPIGRARQIIHCARFAGKYRAVGGRRVSEEISCGQAGAAGKRITADTGGTIWNCYAGQTDAFVKHLVSDIGDTVWN